MTKFLLPFMAVLLFSISSNGSAIGIVIARSPDTPPPLLQSVAVNATIKQNVAVTRIAQVFKNNQSRPVEADFYFPVPNGSDITDFLLYMDGKPVKGEVMGKDEAHSIYREIVRKMKDPGLIEWSEKNLFRVRIFPIPAHGEQKLEIEISQPLTADQGYFCYSVPLQTGRHRESSFGLPSIDFSATIHSNAPIRNIYSPTHKIDMTTSNPRSALITAKNDGKDVPREFALYYENSEKDIAVSLLANRQASKDGHFTLRISPPWDSATTSSQPSDYIFVIDTSGSMAETNKMDQAKKALMYCLNLLKDQDRFNVVRFSTTIESFQESLADGTSANRKQAVEWVTKLDSRGGTNISEALKTALNLRKSDDKRLFTVVFITDGQPTVGQTSPEAIQKTVAEASKGSTRIFTFGIGHDVNARLLDGIAESTRAVSDYVSPDADMEVPISRFFDKISRPALINLELSIPNAQITEVYPPQLPDLFYGTELTVFGRYRKPGPAIIKLTGTIGEEKREYEFEKTFPDNSNENGFVEKLWATRKVAWLLDQVRVNGENAELRKEIELLANQYSIVTPYTSFLAMEDKASQSPVAIDVRPAPAKPSNSRGASGYNPARGTRSAGDVYSLSSAVPSSLALKSQSGEIAVKTAKDLGEMKSAEMVTQRQDTTVIRISGRTFRLENNVWRDDSITDTDIDSVKIRYLSDAWFLLSENFEPLRKIFALGGQVQIKLPNGKILEISESGIENISLSEVSSWQIEKL